MKKTGIVLLMSMMAGLTACHLQDNQKDSRDALRQADLDFSEYSVEHGMNAAFLAFADSTAVLLRPGSPPVRDLGSIGNLLRQKDDSGFNLSWEPEGAYVAASGDLGYTYGTYTISAGEKRSRGTYVTIWKKDARGTWKYVLDSGNSGLGDED